MKPKYYLSNRQRKELLVRRIELTIALPAPEAEEYDALEFARGALVDVEPQWIAAAAETSLAVLPGGTGGLTGLLGTIPGADAAPGWRAMQLVVLVTLRVGDDPRGRTIQPQWPARCQCGEYAYGE